MWIILIGFFLFVEVNLQLREDLGRLNMHIDDFLQKEMLREPSPVNGGQVS